MARIFSALDSDLAEFYARGGGKAGPSPLVARGYARWLFRRGREAEADALLRDVIERTTDAIERQALTADLWAMRVFQTDPRKRAQVRRPRQLRIAAAVTAGLIVAGAAMFDLAFARKEEARLQAEARADELARVERARLRRLPGTAVERRRFVELQALAKTGDADAMYELSRHYRIGRTTPFNAEEERRWLERAAEKNHALAERTLAHWHRLGRGGAKTNPPEAFAWMQRAAGHGDSEARQWLVHFYIFGQGVAEDPARARQLCEVLAKEGDAWAKAELPQFSLYGWGVPKNEAAGLALLQSEAEAGNAAALEALGLCHEGGAGVTKDNAAAVRYYERAASLGSIGAKGALARLLYRGPGVAHDRNRAEKLAREAAAEDNRAAQDELALILMYGARTPAAREEARYWAERALNENRAAAMRTVAELLLGGTANAADAARARALVRAHAETGNASSMARLAGLLRRGVGGSKDGSEALRWWHKAVEAGNVAAMLDLAEVYEQGDATAGIFADRREAKRLLELAAAKDSEEAKKRLETFADVTSALSPEEASWVAPAGALDNLPENGQPVPLRQRRPIYPVEMRRQNVSGEVVVDFIVSEKGQPINAFAIRVSREEFREAALRAVRSWAFRPGTKAGRPVRTHMQVPIVFYLEDESGKRPQPSPAKK